MLILTITLLLHHIEGVCMEPYKDAVDTAIEAELTVDAPGTGLLSQMIGLVARQEQHRDHEAAVERARKRQEQRKSRSSGHRAVGRHQQQQSLGLAAPPEHVDLFITEVEEVKEPW